jgi:hypothetical protein
MALRDAITQLDERRKQSAEGIEITILWSQRLSTSHGPDQLGAVQRGTASMPVREKRPRIAELRPAPSFSRLQTPGDCRGSAAFWPTGLRLHRRDRLAGGGMDSNHRSLSRRSWFVLRNSNWGIETGAAPQRVVPLRGTDGWNPSPSSGVSPQTPANAGCLRAKQVRGGPARARAISLVQRRRISRAWRTTLPTVLSSKKRSRLGLAV